MTQRDFIIRMTLYGSLSLLIIGPLLVPGFVFALDMIFAPGPAAADFLGRPSYPLYLLIDFFELFLPADATQKILLLSIIMLSAWGADAFLRYVLGNKTHLQVIAAGIALYLFNPFVYGRFMTGQFSVLLGYACIPFFVVSLLRFLDKLSWRRAIMLAGWTMAVSTVSIHTMGLLLIISLPLVGLYGYRHRKNWLWLKEMLIKGAAVIGMCLLVSSYWLLPTLLGQGPLLYTISGINTGDFLAYATNDQPWGVLGNVLTMQGFWADAANLYLTAADVYWWWFIPLSLLIGVAFIGVYAGWKAKRGLSIAFLVMFVIAAVLSTGTAGTIFSSFNTWLANHIPLFAGYREPQKFIAIIVLAYVFFVGLGTQHLIQMLKEVKPKPAFEIIGIGVALIAIACAPLTIGGFRGQLRANDYPREWYAMNEYLKQQVSHEQKVLALPWHLYMRFAFAGRIIANPMDSFFAPDVVINDSPELTRAGTYVSRDKLQQKVSAILADSAAYDHLSTQLQNLGFTHILLVKEFDYQKYNYLTTLPGVQLIKDSSNIQLYKLSPGRL